MKKTVFITGATSGIGRIITEMLVKKDTPFMQLEEMTVPSTI